MSAAFTGTMLCDAKLAPGTKVRLHLVDRSELDNIKGVVESFSTSANRYVVQLEDGHGRWKVQPRQLLREGATVDELITEAHGFRDIAHEEVQQLEQIHGEGLVACLVDELIKCPTPEWKKGRWSVAADLQLVVREPSAVLKEDAMGRAV